MAETPIPITTGSGSASVAADLVGGNSYQQIKVVDGTLGSNTALKVNADNSITASVYGSVTISGSPSISGAVTIVGTPSISGAVTVVGTPSISGQVGASIIGQLPGGNAVLGAVAASISGSVTVSGLQGASVSGTVGASVIGTVPFTQSGTFISSVVSTIPSSVLVGASIFGQLPAGTAVLGSVATLQGTNPWNVAGSVAAFLVGNASVITVQQSSSVIAVPVGSVITVGQNPSIVGTYLEDNASSSGDRGLFVLNVRNDTLSSVTSNDGDYSALTVGPTGEVVVANAPITKWVQGTADFRSQSGASGGASVAVIAPQGASIFTYITALQVANMGSASVLVTLSGATSSIIGYTIAPAGGGSNILYPNALKTNANGAFTASISGVSSVLISAQGFISKT